MKTLTQHIEEKLVVNKDYHSATDISQLKKLDWEDKGYDIMTMEITAIDQVKDWVIANSIEKLNHRDEFVQLAEKNCIMLYNNSKRVLIVFRRAPHTSLNGTPRYDECEVLMYPNKKTRMMYHENIGAINIPIFNPNNSLSINFTSSYVCIS